jgi:hypothetical protein
MSWYRVPLWDLWPDITSCRNVAVWNLGSFIYGAPSLTKGRVSNLQCNHSMVRVAQNRNHVLLSHLRFPQPGGPGSRIYIPQEQGGPVIPPGTGFPLHRLLRLAGLRWKYSNPLLPGGTGPWIYIAFRNRMVKSKVKSMLKSKSLGIKGVPSEKLQFGIRKAKFFYVTIGGAAWEACSATWNLDTSSAFALGQRKTMENLDRVGLSQDFPDANWLLASSPALNTSPGFVPICSL